MSELGPFGFIGGLNTKAGPFTIQKDQMSAAQNVNVIFGRLDKLTGSASINSSAISGTPEVHGLADWQTVAGQRSLVVTAGTKVFKTNDLGSTLTDITGGTTVTSGANNQHTFSSLNNILAICGGTTPDTPLQWTGTGNVSALAGSPPVGNLVATANNFMFISGVAASPSNIYWSNASDPGTWPAGSSLAFRASDGDVVTAIAPMNYNLIVYKRRSTGLLYTQTNVTSGTVTLGPLTQINVGVGCCGSQGWDVLPDGRHVVFGADAHLRIFDGNTFEDISDPEYPASSIQPTLDAMNAVRIPFACVRVYPTKKQVWLAVSTGSNTTNDSIFIWDYELQTWQCQVPDRAANVMCTSIDTRSTPSHPIILVTGNYGGFVIEHDKGTTNFENADGHIDGYGTVSIPLGTESRDFIPRSIRVAQEAQSAGQLQVGWGFNAFTDIMNSKIISDLQGGALLDSTFILDTSFLAGSSVLITPVALTGSAKCFTFQVQFRNQYASQPFQVYPFMISDEVII